ncbi:hypothetical protein ACFFNY_15620 [Paenibacillus hodogayensis]|uniref:Uncharacterized protein n=1 Tax=Paenibacillus hodogayensis TaxID=279208 RepID=A0ABV5VY50_9BACL
MSGLTVRPDLKTAGGEVTELLFDGRFVGVMTLVYREGGRLSGSIQLESKSLEARSKNEVVRAARAYVEHLTDALGADDCEVIVTCSSYERILAAGYHRGDTDSFADETELYDLQADGDGDDDGHLEDIDPEQSDTIEMYADPDEEPDIDLVVVGESRNRIEYHLYDGEQNWLGEAYVRISGASVYAEIDWRYEPDEEESEYAAELLVADFDPDEVDLFRIEMKLDGELLETIQLAHEDLLDEDEDEEADEADVVPLFSRERDYSVVLVRNDGDTLTYDLYEQSHGGLPIAQATVVVSQRELTGFIDFRDPESSADREYIGSLLMRELDKDEDCESLNLTMLVNNELIDEIWYETEYFH